MHTKLTGVLRCVKGLDPPTQAVPTEANGIGRGVPRTCTPERKGISECTLRLLSPFGQAKQSLRGEKEKPKRRKRRQKPAEQEAEPCSWSERVVAQ